MTCIVCAAWFPFSVHILNGITSINLIFIHCSVPTQCPILCSVPHSLSSYSLSSSDISLMLSPGAGVWSMGQSTLESDHWRLMRSHSAQGVSLLHWPLSTHCPGDTRIRPQGHWPGLAWQVSPPLTVTDTLARAALTTGLPAPGTDLTHAGEVVVFWNNGIEIK